MSITLTHHQAQAILDAFGGDRETEFTIVEYGMDAHSGSGLYGYYTEYPEEGVMFFGEDEEDQQRGNMISESRGYQ